MMPPREQDREAAMWRQMAIVLAVLCIGATCGNAAVAADASGKIRLAQSSTLTNCMMSCNSTAAACVTTCISPGTAPTGAATTTSNANLNTACQVNCATQRLQCQTTCAQSYPSQ
jgi:hypothetical protein